MFTGFDLDAPKIFGKAIHKTSMSNAYIKKEQMKAQEQLIPLTNDNIFITVHKYQMFY